MRFSAVLIIILSFFISACANSYGIKREINPIEGFYTQKEKCGSLIATESYYELVIEKIDELHWKDLLDYRIFKNDKKTMSVWRDPKLSFFQIILFNKGDVPIRIDSVRLTYGNIEKKSLSITEVKKKCKSPVYSLFNFERILGNLRHIAFAEPCLKDIDFKNDVVAYNLDFINPNDRISRIIAFEWIPVQYRKFKVIVKLEFSGKEKMIDFGFRRFEYRSQGKHFIKKNEDQNMEEK